MPAPPARVIALPAARGRPSADWPLCRYVDWWLDIGAPNLAPESRRTYRHVTRPLLDAAGDVPLGELSAMDLQPALSRMLAAGKSEATVYLARCGISSALASAVRLGLIDTNPARGLSSPTPEAPDRTVLGPAQVARLIDALDAARPWPPVNAVLAILLQTGVRQGEGVAPRMADLDLDSPRPALRIEYQAQPAGGRTWARRRPKTRRGRRIVPLPPDAVAAIRRRLDLHPRPPAGDDYALGVTLARPYSKTAVTMALRSACKATGLPIITPHECRTSYATNAAAAGVPIVTLAAILGDRPETIMRHYVKTDFAQAAEAVARMFARPAPDAV